MRARAERPPALVLAGAAVAAAFFGLPLVALLLRAPWGRAAADLGGPDALLALRLSLLTSFSATALALLFGVPLAWVLARARFPGRSLLRALVTLPMVLPPVVGGVALLLAFGRAGLLGPLLGAAGIRLPFTTAGAVLAETLVAMPFLVITVEAGLRSLDTRFEEAARTLGAGRWYLFRRVTLPLLAPSLFAGAVLCWARALGEFGATITFAGNLQGSTQTLPLFVFIKLEGSDPDAAIILSLLLMGISVGVLVALRDRWMTAR